MARFSVTCCHSMRAVVSTTRPQGDAELVRLRDHVRHEHAREALPADAGVAAMLAHYVVEREDEAR